MNAADRAQSPPQLHELAHDLDVDLTPDGTKPPPNPYPLRRPLWHYMISHVILKQDEPYRLDFAATSRGDAPARDFIRELRVSFGRREIRLLYFIHGRTIVLTHGFLKKTRALPPEEIVRAERLRALWLSSPEEYS